MKSPFNWLQWCRPRWTLSLAQFPQLHPDCDPPQFPYGLLFALPVYISHCPFTFRIAYLPHAIRGGAYPNDPQSVEPMKFEN